MEMTTSAGETAGQKVTDQQLLDELKNYSQEAPQACVDAQIAGMYALNFCKHPPLGFKLSQATHPNGLAAMQLATINRCVASLSKSAQVDIESANLFMQTIKISRFL